MELRLYKTLWGYNDSLENAVMECREQGFDGIEGQPPPLKSVRSEFRKRMAEAGLGFIAEICTAGSYVPDRQASPYKHLESLRSHAEAAMECAPRFLTVIAGCDAWSIGQSVDFFGTALQMLDEFGIAVSFETHRSRSFFNPWTTREILLQLPGLKLTCDFSHWCVVCERLIDTEPDIIALCAERAQHVHARVGYDQGPQVPHPAAPEFQPALEAHERWWSLIWRSQRTRGFTVSTMTPEFGPDGYLHCQPFTREPVADLAEINRWMAKRQREQFSKTFIAEVNGACGKIDLTQAA